jgi:rhodanese-related sulfurtransferase
MKHYNMYRALFFFTLITSILLSPVIGIRAAASEYGDELLSVEEAIDLKNDDPRTIYIDVRRQDLFKKSHIPTSINIPLHFIKTKQYLKSMKLILINEGYFLEPLYKEHDRLAKLGFDTRILAGGIAAWNQQGQELTGVSFPHDLTLHLAPANSMTSAIRLDKIKLFIDISEMSQEDIFQGATILPTANQEDVDNLLTFIEGQGLDEKSAVLIFNQEGNYQLLEDLPPYCRPTLFFLEGGISAYQAAITSTQAMLQPLEKRTKKIGGCATCPPATEISQ